MGRGRALACLARLGAASLAWSGCVGSNDQATPPAVDASFDANLGAPDTSVPARDATPPPSPEDAALDAPADASVDAGPPSVVGLPASLSFGLVDCGGANPPDKVVTLTNAGGADLHVFVGLQNGGGPFTLSTSQLTIAPGASAPFTLSAQSVPATATAGLAFTDTLVVRTDDPQNASASIPVSMTPHGATVTVSPPAAAFGNVTTGTTSTIPVSIANTGNADVVVTPGAPTDPRFASVTTPLAVAAGQSSSLPIAFTPTTAAPSQASIALALSGAPTCGAVPSTIALSGQGVSACANANGGCDPNAACTLAPAGTPVCACLPGFTGDGKACASDDYAQWPVPPDAPPEPGYVVSADGTVVLDLVTKLVWQRDVLADPCPASDAGAPGCSWSDAQAYCASLDSAGLGGLTSGWRLPSVVELASIVNFGDGVPSIDTALFPATPAVGFWSSTPAAAAAGQAWALSFATGINGTQPASTLSLARCVSSMPEGAASSTCGASGQPCCYAASCGVDLACNGGTCIVAADYAQSAVPSDAPLERSSTVSADGSLVTDGTTGLHWQRQLLASPCPGDGPGGCTRADAAAYCHSLDALAVGGISAGWRLPSVLELASIVNYAAAPPMLDTALFPGTPTSAPFWSATTNAASPAQGWTLSYATGTNASQAATTASPVRCVTSSPVTSTPACGHAGETCCYASACGPDLACASGVCGPASDYLQSPAPLDAPRESTSTVSADGTIVTDAATGLSWQRQVFANPCPNDGAGVCTWADAAAYCASLSASSFGGITSGWRLPSVMELLGVVNYAGSPPMLDTALFPATPVASFWTGTPNAAAGGQAWLVSMSNGINASAAVTAVNAVRCVSSVAPSASPASCGLVGDPCCYANSCGPDLACTLGGACVVDATYAQSKLPADAPPEPGFALSPGGSVVVDSVTGLVWQRQILSTPPSCAAADAGAGAPGCTWSDAAAYCASLDGLALGGYSAGWRLPSVTELLSIVNFAATPTIDPAPFSNPPPSTFWSGTLQASSPSAAWTVSYANGIDAASPITSLFAVRCVNGGVGKPAPEGCGALGQSCCYAGTCAASLACAGGTCVTDTNYARAVVPPDAPPDADFTAGAQQVTDSATGLTWALQPGGTTPCPSDGTGVCTWSKASALCASLASSTFGGRAGWRLPALYELLTIVDYSVASGPRVDQAKFAGVTASSYWTATPLAGNAASAWSLSFASGVNSAASTTTALGPLCVTSN
jgi:hypothetical protein